MSRQHYQASTYRVQNSVGYLVKRANSLTLDLLEPIFEGHGFTLMQYQILVWLRDGIAINPKDICTQFRHNSGALTRVIDQLVERGFIARSRSDRDRRKVDLELTPAGLRMVEELIPSVVDKLNFVLAGFSAAEVEELVRLLIKLNGAMEAAVEPAFHEEV